MGVEVFEVPPSRWCFLRTACNFTEGFSSEWSSFFGMGRGVCENPARVDFDKSRFLDADGIGSVF